MKKIFLCFTIIGISLVLSSSAFAVATLDNTASTTIGGANFIPSTSVTLMAETSTLRTAFIVSAKHLSGDKVYSATSAAPSVVESDSAVGTELSAIVATMP